jgi:uncharacterized protein (UPF0210 family)
MDTSNWRIAAVVACILISGLVSALAQKTENEKLASFFDAIWTSAFAAARRGDEAGRSPF